MGRLDDLVTRLLTVMLLFKSQMNIWKRRINGIICKKSREPIGIGIKEVV